MSKVNLPHFDNLPERFSRLGELAYNLWWSWAPPARALFRSLDLGLWRSTRHNPVRILREISLQTIEQRTRDFEFVEAYERVLESYDRYMQGEDTWFARRFPDRRDWQVAYFCAEFGLHGSIPIYSGGLGILAGDTCKEASDLGLPFTGIGYFYPEGYFQQNIAPDGRQEATYIRAQPEFAPILPVVDEEGKRCLVRVPVADREVAIAVWKVQAGRVPVYLMDTCIEENDPWERDVSARLYGGDHSVRLRQEVILGMGGLKVLRSLGYRPDVLHLNEGHAAFAALELLPQFLSQDRDFEEALREVRRRIVFTTHTPVKAGHDEFSFQMIEDHFDSYRRRFGLSREKLIELGRPPDGDSFVMTVMALRTSGRSNGVSRIHGGVSRKMWRSLWADLPSEQVPIGSITNGVHVPTWISQEMDALLGKYLGKDWLAHHDQADIWDKIDSIPDAELWSVHFVLKRRLLRLVRERARAQWRQGTSSNQIVAFGALLDPDVLTVGFARRFATYKRGNLILRDRDRLQRMLLDPRRPVQFIFAGKAHPADEHGKYVLQEIFRACMSHESGGRIAFVEEYDKHVGQLMVQGVDVWLNTPVPLLEASGTSGQKASLNGVPNFSVLDGWWHEGHNGRNGWAIDAETGKDDAAAASAVYDILEREIAPLYYRRGPQGIPAGWVSLMKEAIRSLAAPFSARRMMKEYVEKLYLTVGQVEDAPSLSSQ